MADDDEGGEVVHMTYLVKNGRVIRTRCGEVGQSSVWGDDVTCLDCQPFRKVNGVLIDVRTGKALPGVEQDIQPPKRRVLRKKRAQ